MAKLAFVDCETTGLDPTRHQIWELAIILEEDGKTREYAWQLPVNLFLADPNGLRIGRFYERRSKIDRRVPLASHHKVLWGNSETTWQGAGPIVAETAETVAVLLDGAHMVGAVPSFDASFLTPWLNSHGQAATWHYHLVDVEAMAAGWLAGSGTALQAASLPWDSDVLSGAVGVDPDDFDRHTALGDAKWSRAIYHAVMSNNRS